jgi:hypothetical protein
MVMSAGQYKDNEDKDVMGYELPRRVRGEKESVRVSPANRDKKPHLFMNVIGAYIEVHVVHHLSCSVRGVVDVV